MVFAFLTFVLFRRAPGPEEGEQGGADIRTSDIGVGREDGVGHFFIQLFYRVDFGVDNIPFQNFVAMPFMVTNRSFWARRFLLREASSSPMILHFGDGLACVLAETSHGVHHQGVKINTLLGTFSVVGTSFGAFTWVLLVTDG